MKALSQWAPVTKALSAAPLILSACSDPPPIACAEIQNSVADRIEEAGYVPIGGIDQWVTMRGNDRSNPILLHVHGGPGVTFSVFIDEFAPYEADFTIVHWDQRGSGCTFGRYGEDTPEVTFDRIVRDGIEIATHLKGRLGNQEIIVLGHSLGSVVANEMVQRAPQYFSVYVGVAQFVSFQGTVEAQLAYLRDIGEAEDDADLISAVDTIGLPQPANLQDFFAVNRLLFNHVPADDATWTQHMQSRGPEVMTPAELADWNQGREATVGWLMPEVPQVDLFATAPRLEVPFIVIQGSEDIYSPTELAIAYLENVEAPGKELVVIEGAAHFPHLTHIEEFLSALVETTRPFLME